MKKNLKILFFHFFVAFGLYCFKGIRMGGNLWRLECTLNEKIKTDRRLKAWPIWGVFERRRELSLTQSNYNLKYKSKQHQNAINYVNIISFRSSTSGDKIIIKICSNLLNTKDKYSSLSSFRDTLNFYVVFIPLDLQFLFFYQKVLKTLQN